MRRKDPPRRGSWRSPRFPPRWPSPDSSVGEQKPDELRIPVFPGREHDRRASVRVSGMDVHSTGPQQHPSDRVVIRIEPLTGNKQRGVRPQFDSGSGSTPCSRRYRVTRTIRLRTARMS
ncbi:hypothetical protein KXX07_000356 [Aspergillus fumigatus]|nr:hypothetical protein KXX07_000356 [Aspergillus fumigatus]